MKSDNTQGLSAGRTSSPAMSARDWTMLLTLAVLWGGSFFFAKVAVAEIPPLTVVLCRVVLAAATLHAILRLRAIAFPPPARWPAYLGMAIINNVIPFSLLFYGQTRIGAGLASILNATTPIFAVIIAHLFTADERISSNKAAGIVLGVAGIAVLVGIDALHDIGADVVAQLACLGAALSYGFSAVFGRRFRTDPPVASAAAQVSASSLVMLPIVAFVDAPWTLPVPSQAAIWSVLMLGVVSTAFAYILFFAILQSAGATNISLVTLLVPVTAILLGALVLGERLGASDLVGMGLIALGLSAIDGRLWRGLGLRFRQSAG